MAADRGLTALEVLGVAIRSEIEASALYAGIATRVRNSSLVAKLNFLRQEEEKHRAMLEDMYARQFPDVELKLPAHSPLPPSDMVVSDSLAVPQLFELAMKAERSSADFYSQQGGDSRDPAGRSLLRYLSNVEQSHYHVLETEYDLVSRFPEYYNADEFHFGTELMHVGP